MNHPVEAARRGAQIASLYENKPTGYFGNVRQDIVALLPTGGTSCVLELGCGSGGTGRAVLTAGKAGRYVGIELNPAAALEAKKGLSEVLVGDVQEIDLTALNGKFDALIVSEVLEHLTDPWGSMERLVTCLKPGGLVYSSSPNIGHWTVIRDLILGRFRYAESGFMDRTHLRWFTPDSYRALFEQAGIEILQVGPLVPWRAKARLFNLLTVGRFSHLFTGQIMLVGRKAA